ncbi:MAG: PP2C family protein-serine/threonine phosphatase [Solirubrobacteraceae bacterium]
MFSLGAQAGEDPPSGGTQPRTAGDRDQQPKSVGASAVRWPLWLPLGTLLIGLLLTALLALGAAAQFHSNEKRLLRLRVHDAGLLLTAALPDLQSSLAAAAELAGATDGDVQKFRRNVAPLVGTSPGHQFVSVSLWRNSRAARGPLTVVGVTPKLDTRSAVAFFAASARSRSLGVIGLLQPPDLRLGFVFAASSTGGFLAYGESALPRDRRSRLESNSAFADIDYAIYLGASQRPADLLLTSVSHLPLSGQRAAVTVPFGTNELTLVMSARKPLAGSLAQELPWIIAIGGLIVSLGFSTIAGRLAVRRRTAELLASENRRLYSEQRNIAQTLQHALLPDKLPEIRGLQASARYEPGQQGVDVGGDWYDLIELDDHRVLLVVGDVSGRGLRAATTMAALRYAIRGYAAQDDPPATILSKLSDLISIKDDDQLATVLCACLDLQRREISLASAGHLPALLLTDGHGEYLHAPVGLPIGVQEGTRYEPRTVTMPKEATLLAFTDGLVEVRSDKSIDDGLERLRNAALGDRSELSELLHRLVGQLHQGLSADDTAILGVRWTD